jgi:hypothetical protein
VPGFETDTTHVRQRNAKDPEEELLGLFLNYTQKVYSLTEIPTFFSKSTTLPDLHNLWLITP